MEGGKWESQGVWRGSEGREKGVRRTALMERGGASKEDRLQYREGTQRSFVVARDPMNLRPYILPLSRSSEKLCGVRLHACAPWWGSNSSCAQLLAFFVV